MCASTIEGGKHCRVSGTQHIHLPHPLCAIRARPEHNWLDADVGDAKVGRMRDKSEFALLRIPGNFGVHWGCEQGHIP